MNAAIYQGNPITFPGLGITVNPDPVAFTIFGKDVYWYGVIIAIGFLLAAFYMMRRAKTFGLNEDIALDMLIWAVPIGVICARAYYCIFYWELFADDPISVFYIWKGGLAIYGGVIGGAITLLILAKVKKLPAMTLLDLAAMGVIIGQICGRWGNFFNREVFGAATDDFFLRMGLTTAAGEVHCYHPVFLYESLWNLAGFLALHFYTKKRKFDGEVFLLYMGWYGLGRFWIEGVRATTDSLKLFNTGLYVSQVLAGVFFVGSLSILLYMYLKKKPTAAGLYANRSLEEAPMEDDGEAIAREQSVEEASEEAEKSE